jgi:ATP-dependent DNA ligase
MFMHFSGIEREKSRAVGSEGIMLKKKFGPVRTVKPELVFEIAFEGIAASSRHKSGVALSFLRISRWRRDESPKTQTPYRI